MSASETIEQTAPAVDKSPQKRKMVNAIWQPFLQFKLLMFMLGATALVAVLLGAFLYFAFGDLIGSISHSSDGTSYYQDEINNQLISVFRYCGGLFILYVLLLGAVCISYTHKLIGPFRPFSRHIDELVKGNYGHRVKLRKGDVELLTSYADKLNELAEQLEKKEKQG